jgi:tRNA(Ile)-lysidine synthase
MTDALVDRIRQVVSIELGDAGSTMLAVSGGIDSMVLLDAAIATCPVGAFRVATFDHASGPHSGRAVDLVQRVSLTAGATVIVGRSMAPARPSEASWRDGRLSFLRGAAAEHRSILCTAHTRDDQVETVLFRELRGAGTRGLAGLRASGAIRRPLLRIGRSDIERYAREAGLTWIEDPSNKSGSFARNRLRHEVLPALRVRTPTIDTDLTEIGERAARWRDDVDKAIDALIDFDADAAEPALDVSIESLCSYEAEALGIIWPALLARIGVIADWRGTRRLVEFTNRGSTGRRIQLSGGWVVTRRRGGFEVRRQGSRN